MPDATIMMLSTTALEGELHSLSSDITTGREKVTNDQARFQSITAELKRRRETGESPPAEPRFMTNEQLTEEANGIAQATNQTLVNKLIMMEAEQARLVIEVEAAKFAKNEAEARLALVTKYYKQPDNT